MHTIGCMGCMGCNGSTKGYCMHDRMGVHIIFNKTRLVLVNIDPEVLARCGHCQGDVHQCLLSKDLNVTYFLVIFLKMITKQLDLEQVQTRSHESCTVNRSWFPNQWLNGNWDSRLQMLHDPTKKQRHQLNQLPVILKAMFRVPCEFVPNGGQLPLSHSASRLDQLASSMNFVFPHRWIQTLF